MPADKKIGSNKECVPFVSEYSDCTEANVCTGCRRCTCGSEGSWNCNYVTECPIIDKEVEQQPEMVDNALDMLKSVIASGKHVQIKPALIKDKETDSSNNLLIVNGDIDQQILSLISRRRRHIDTNNNTHAPIEFFNTVDEYNEDTLINSNDTGTILAATVLPNLQQTRRFDNTSKMNGMNYLNIKNNGPIEQNIMDNSIDVSNKKDHKLGKTGAKNATTNKRDKVISKIIVDEIKPGEEKIGDVNGPIISKISFTPANDTITAMAYIAGNLLNKLWYMEKGSEESSEIDKIKKEKINDLLEVFKAPLTIRQETFLKNALEILSKAIIDKEENGYNIDNTLCEKLQALFATLNNGTIEDDKLKQEQLSGRKMTNILDLLNDYKSVKNTLELVETGTSNVTTNKPVLNNPVINKLENKDHALFGSLLEKVTKLLSPESKQKSINKNIRKLNLFKKNLNLHPKLKDLFNLDPDELTLSVKDKIIIDYLNAMQEQPDCLLGTLLNGKNFNFPKRNIEENILLNLSEFYKIKSYTDLIKLIGSKEKSEPVTQSKRSNINESTTEMLIVETTEKPINQTKNTKELLKQHLKELLTDLKEIKNNNDDEDFDISDVLPCLSHFIKSDSEKSNINSKQLDTPAGRLIKTLNQLRLDLKKPTRRAQVSDDLENEPKSLIVWDRVISNLESQVSGRRSNYNILKAKNIDDAIYALKKLNVTLKNYSSGNKVQPSDRLVLLKLLLIDIKQYINVIEHLKEVVEMNTVSNEKMSTVDELLDDAKRNMHEREVIIVNMKNNNEDVIVTNRNSFDVFAVDTEVKKPKASKEFSDDYLNKIIKDRVKVILSKINKEEDTLRYNIAKKIIDNFNKGNPTMARELYKILVAKTNDQSKEISHYGLPVAKQDQVVTETKYIGKEQSQEAMWIPGEVLNNERYTF